MATTPTTTPMCMDGVSVAAVRRFMSQLGDYYPGGFDHVTTADACIKPVMHRTRETQCSVVDLLRSTNPEEVRPATVFVSHAWQYKIVDVLTTMLEYAEAEDEKHKNEDDGTKKETFFWFDLFCINQHPSHRTSLTQEQIGTTFKEAIASIGQVLLVLTPWSDPVPLTRAWCLWEIFCAISRGDDVLLEIKLPQHQRQELRRAVTTDASAITNMLVDVRAEHAQAHEPADREMIFKAIEESVGFQQLNKAVKDQMRAWCLDMAESFVVEMEQKGDTHSSEYALTCRQVGNVMDEFGEWGKAIALYNKNLACSIEQLGHEHENVGKAYNNIANAHDSQGNNDKALEYYHKALDIFTATNGRMHHNTGKTYNNLGEAFRAKGDYAKAIDCYQQALEIFLADGSEEHAAQPLLAAAALNNLGSTFQHMGDYARALEYHERTLAIRRKVLGEGHPQTATSYTNIGALYLETDEYAQAIELFQKAVDIYTVSLGERHPTTAMTLSNLGLAYDNSGQLDQALEAYMRALDIVLAALGRTHIILGTLYNNIGKVHAERDDAREAIKWYEQALEVYRHNDLDTHPSAAQTYSNMGNMYDALGDSSRALAFLTTALDIEQRVLGPDHTSTAKTLENMGIAFSHLGDHCSALDHITRALNIFTTKLGPKHPQTRKTTDNLKTVQDRSMATPS
ncbi:mbre TPR repeat protein [Salpingoeca rosetta]|uniref:Mbre TPR repeat protein n=1 Tax=Salpingoeca rosetta (strain ATCC 50818 / BSB-021) TaxID=946362 RepID=F2UCD4_SALR5|nr:mbre TPR repeat protein [Salpingoeca rosetta]EGD74241.1 mbre TPR repeat protein [Salpingoeca rosetta]|eukprot:XP_004993141.1 mbre TPR repeat protein [Salpingoeca rosetta]